MAKISKAELAAALRDMAARIDADDSFEGRISYSCMEEDCGRGEFEVEAAWRTGNSEGQGGSIIIEASAKSDPSA
jgi:hypothetical protein